MLPARHLLLPAAGCCWLVRAAAGCYLLPAACCCLVVKVAVQHLFFPYALPLASAGVSELVLFFPGSCVINSFSLTHSPLRLPGSADIYIYIYIHICAHDYDYASWLIHVCCIDTTRADLGIRTNWSLKFGKSVIRWRILAFQQATWLGNYIIMNH